MVLLLCLLPLGMELDWKPLSCRSVKSRFYASWILGLLLGSREPVRCTPSPACMWGFCSPLQGTGILSQRLCLPWGDLSVLSEGCSLWAHLPETISHPSLSSLLSVWITSLYMWVFLRQPSDLLFSSSCVFQLIIFKFNFWLNYEKFLCCDIFDF